MVKKYLYEMESDERTGELSGGKVPLSAVCYDIKGRRYIDTPYKFYFTDLGLRNARINFRQMEENHTIEHVIYNEPVGRGFHVDVGLVAYSQKDTSEQPRHIITVYKSQRIGNEQNNKYPVSKKYCLMYNEELIPMI